MEELEPRLLFSADLPTIALDPDSAGIEAPPPAPAIIQTTTSSETHSTERARDAGQRRNELVFIDAGAPNYQQLVDDLTRAVDQGRNIEIVVLDSDRDGIEQITEALNRYRNLDAVHVISHGDDSSLQLGNRQLDQNTLRRNAHVIQSWSDAFNEDADLLLYGCDLAGGAKGQALIDALATLTGADVAASEDRTGSEALGGDWELEYQAGNIETQVAFSPEARSDWQGVLNLAEDDFSTGDYTGGTNWSAPWQETGDTANAINVVEKAPGDWRLLLQGDNSVENYWVSRQIDLSTTTSATLTFDYELENHWSDVFEVAIRDGDSPWQVVQTYDPAGSPGGLRSGTESIIIDPLLRDNGLTEIFADPEFFYVDNVQINYQYPPAATYYLDDDGTGADVPDAALKTTLPTDITLDNYDVVRDALPGTVIAPTALGFAENDPTKYQVWAVQLPSGLTLNDPVHFTIWTAMNNFDVNMAGSIEASLFFAGPSFGTLTEITNVTIERSDWDVADSGTWIEETFDFGVVNHTFGNNRWLGVSVIVNNGGASAIDSEDSMMFAYDTVNFPARLEIGNNNAPVNIVPGIQATNEETPLVFSIANSNLITISDPDVVNNPVQVPLRGTDGTITLAGTTGLTFSAGDGTGDPIMTFTGMMADIDAALDGMQFDPSVDFSGAASIEITTDDLGNSGFGGSLTDVDTVIVNVAPINDDPALKNNTGVTLDEGASATITNTELLVTDPDNTPDQLVFLLQTEPVNGTLELAGVPVTLFTPFTQDDIDAGNLVYIHDGSETLADSFSFNVDDQSGGVIPFATFNITVNPVDDTPPTVGVNLGTTVAEGGSATILNTELRYDDSEQPSTSVVFTLTAEPVNGELRLSGVPITLASPSFTQDDIDAGRVTYLHFGGANVSDTFNFDVDDGQGNALTGQSYTITVTPVNDAPTITDLAGDNLAYSEGDGARIIDQGILAGVADVDSGDFDTGNLTVTISAGGVASEDVLAIDTAGTVTLSAGMSVTSIVSVGGVAIGTITNDGSGGNDLAVTFNANATAARVATLVQAITYENTNTATPTVGVRTVGFTVADGDGATSVSYDATVTVTAVNDEQVLATNTGTTVAEASTGTVITAAMLATTDVDNTPAQLVYTLSAVPVNGTLRLGGTALVASDTFTQADIDAGLVTYDHDGSETLADGFDFSVDDGAGAVTNATFAITVTPVNDPPAITSNGGLATANVAIDENTTAVTTVTSTDVDGGVPAYSIVPGLDGAFFIINAASGILTFASAPDFENPLDANGDNVYDVQVRVDDGAGGFDLQTISVTVNDISNNLVVTTALDIVDAPDWSSIEALNANKGADGQVSLNEAIRAANSQLGLDTITFNIGGGGPFTIAVGAGGLMPITDPVVIDATTQPGWVNDPIIELDGSLAGTDGFILGPGSGGSTIRGFIINSFGGAGILVNSSNNFIRGNRRTESPRQERHFRQLRPWHRAREQQQQHHPGQLHRHRQHRHPGAREQWRRHIPVELLGRQYHRRIQPGRQERHLGEHDGRRVHRRKRQQLPTGQLHRCRPLRYRAARKPLQRRRDLGQRRQRHRRWGAWSPKCHFRECRQRRPNRRRIVDRQPDSRQFHRHRQHPAQSVTETSSQETTDPESGSAELVTTTYWAITSALMSPGTFHSATTATASRSSTPSTTTSAASIPERGMSSPATPASASISSVAAPTRYRPM
jgi:hypothetical protein